VSATWHSHTQTRTGPHNAPPHSHHFPQRTQPPHMQSRTGDGLHRRQRREQGSAAQWTCTRRQPPAQANRPHIPTQHRTTPCRSPARGPGWRVVARFKLTCYHVLLTRSTTGCTHLRSEVGAENRESGRGEGDKGHGVTAAWHIHNTQTGLHNAPPYSRHFPHRTQPLHMQSRTGDSLHRAQGEGRGAWRLGRATAHTDKHNTMALTSAGLWWRVVAHFKLTCYHVHFARSTAACTHNTWGTGRQRGEQGEGGGGGQPGRL
jgi:hypothetical protein